ncbi:MAG: mercuric reductase [Deltaproteobacteria bacterium]|nr:mercuric reductase [Deltaproteobacteria bacterium]
MTQSSSLALTLTPDDEHNRVLAKLTHPPQWLSPVPKGRYNLVVVGAGTAGLVAAAGAAGLGARVALIERHQTGGDCLNTGCVPSKAVIRAARAAYDAANAAPFGVSTPAAPVVDFAAVMERMRRLRARIAPNDSFERFSGLGVDMYQGEAKFVSGTRVEVNGVALDFSKAVIASGARAAVPPIPGLADAGFYTNETVFNLTSLAKRWLVLGAGPIGCELAQSFRRFGAEVMVMALDARLLPREDADASEVLRRRFAKEGIRTELGVKPVKVERVGEVRLVTFDRDGKADTVEVDALLVATGRAPNVEGLGFEAAGVAFDKRGVTVDDALRTTNPRIYASGDVAGRWQFTHAADAMSRIVLQNALFWGRKKASVLTIPWATYTDPEIAHVGLSEAEARQRGLDAVTYTVPLSDVDRAILESDDEGFARLHAERKSGRILGATLVGRDAGDLIGEMSLAVTNKLTLGQLAATIHPYPTRAEAWKRIGDLHSRTRLTPLVKRLFERLLAWQR